MNYGKQLETLREREGLSKTNMAKYLNIDVSLYFKYEKEQQTIPIKHLNTVCNYFGVSLDYIFGFTNKINYKDIRKDINKELSGNRLKNFRKEQNITQSKLAEILNTTQSVIADYERGRYIIATPFLYTICKKYNISADYLLGRIDTNTLKKDI